MTSSQRAALAVDALPHIQARARERQGTRTDLDADLPQIVGECSRHDGEATAEEAQLFQTNRQYVADAATLRAETPALFEDIKSNRVGSRRKPLFPVFFPRGQRALFPVCRGSSSGRL